MESMQDASAPAEAQAVQPSDPDEFVCPECGRAKREFVEKSPGKPSTSQGCISPWLLVFCSMSIGSCIGVNMPQIIGVIHGDYIFTPPWEKRPAPTPVVTAEAPPAPSVPSPPHPTCLPMSRKLLNRTFGEMYPEDFKSKEPLDKTKPFLRCAPGDVKPGQWNKGNWDVTACSICIPSGYVLDLPR